MFEIVQESVKVCTTSMPSRTLYAQHPVSQRIFTSLLGSRLRFLSRCKLSTPTNTPLYSSGINRLYAQNPVFEIVHDESVKAYLHMYNGNVQQNPLCVEICVRNFPSLLGSRQWFLIPMQIQCSYEHTFVQQQ